MKPRTRSTLQQAIRGRVTATLLYNAPLRGGVVTRHVRSYELSVNKAGRPVLWATDSLHGSRRIHSFRVDRIIAATVSDKAKGFTKAASITRDLVHEGAAEPPAAPKGLPRAQGRPPARRPAQRPYKPVPVISVTFGPLKIGRR